MKLRLKIYGAHITHPDFNYEKGLENINNMLEKYFDIEKPLKHHVSLTARGIVVKDDRKYEIQVLKTGAIYVHPASSNKEDNKGDIRVLETMLSIVFDPEDNTILMDQFLADAKKIFEK